MVIQVKLEDNKYLSILDASVKEPYNSSTQKFSGIARQTLGSFGEQDIQLTGSSPFMLVHLQDSGILPEDARLATRADLELARKKSTGSLSDFYADIGLNLQPDANGSYRINSVGAKVLAEDLKTVGLSLDNSLLVPYNTLTLNVRENSPHGLIFRLSEKGKDTAKDVIQNTRDSKWDYLPNSSGLFRAFLYRDGYWGSYYGDLAGSNRFGRVVVVSGKATSQKILGNYTSHFAEARDNFVAYAEETYQKAVSGLRAE